MRRQRRAVDDGAVGADEAGIANRDETAEGRPGADESVAADGIVVADGGVRPDHAGVADAGERIDICARHDQASGAQCRSWADPGIGMPKCRKVESGPHQVAEHLRADLHVLVADPHDQGEITGHEACSQVVGAAQYVFATVEVVHEARDCDSGFLCQHHGKPA